MFWWESLSSVTVVRTGGAEVGDEEGTRVNSLRRQPEESHSRQNAGIILRISCLCVS